MFLGLSNNSWILSKVQNLKCKDVADKFRNASVVCVALAYGVFYDMEEWTQNTLDDVSI